MFRVSFPAIIALILLSIGPTHQAQACQWYTITVTDGATASEVSWNLIDQNGVTWAIGGAPYDADICLPDGCYTLQMFDSGGNGWQYEDWIIEDWIGEFDWDTNLPDGPHGADTFVLGDNQPCDPANNTGCPPGSQTLQFIVTSGSAPAQIGWDVALNGAVIANGGAPYNDTLCLAPGCYVLHLSDAAANGWNGATYTLKYFGGATLFTGTLAAGAADSVLMSIGGATGCTWPGPGGPGDPGGGMCLNSGDPPGDCPSVVCVCDPFTFPITPSSYGTWDEIPNAGSQPSNPYYSFMNPPPWGGTDYGCLLAGELNSSWMMFTIETGGNLGFAFGAGGEQIGFYDWSMWAYTGPGTCAAISSGSLAPVRCDWNAAPWGGTGLANTLPPGGDPGNYGPMLPVNAGDQFIICFSNWSYVTTNVTLDFFGTATIQCGMILPIELLSFDAWRENDLVHTHWATASERDNDHFEVERSVDLIDWHTIGSLAGAGTSQAMHEYDLFDEAPLPGWNYFRLKQVDLDGSASWSEAVPVWFDPPPDVLVYPQPSTGEFQVMAILRAPVLLNAMGQRVPIEVGHDLEHGSTRIRLKEPAAGTYVLMDPDTKGRFRLLIVEP
ncbi:MAG: hypothetical protein KIT10_06865 [Flavobacteriales bacterium]|nr:hypothetical protein [Flavobacteriales bacterium]